MVDSIKISEIYRKYNMCANDEMLRVLKLYASNVLNTEVITAAAINNLSLLDLAEHNDLADENCENLVLAVTLGNVYQS